MKRKQLTLRIFAVTVACFAASYATSVFGHLNGDRPYPLSLGARYALNSGQMTEVDLHRKISAAQSVELDVRTTSINVILKTEKTDQMSISLKGEFYDVGDNQEDVLQTTSSGDKIAVETREINDSHAFHMGLSSPKGQMLITLPSTIKKVILRTVSGDVSLDSLKLDDVAIETVSGDTSITTANASTMNLKSVSGTLRAEGDISTFHGKSISGDLKLRFANLNPTVEIQTTSGDSVVAFKGKPDLKVKFNTISGSLDVDHGFNDSEFEGRKFSFNIGAGKGELFAKSISGGLKVGRY